MIGKIPKPGKSFAGCVKYNVQKKDAVLLYADGVRIEKIEQTIRDFNMQRKMNPTLGQAVGHIALSWSVNDLDKLTDKVMVEVAHVYLQKMKIEDTQVIMVRHHDKNHPHLHLVYNRVNNQGKTISDRFQRQNNIRVCKELTLKYGFYLAPDKEMVNRQQLKGEDKVKYELFDAIRTASKQVRSLDELMNVLKRMGIDMQYKFKSGSKEIQGISFSKDGYKFKGSEIDRGLSYNKLSQAIAERVKLQQQKFEQQPEHQSAQKGELKALADQIREAIRESRESKQAPFREGMLSGDYGPVESDGMSLTDVLTSGLDAMSDILRVQAEPEPPKKKKNGQHQDKEEYRGPRR